MKRATAKTGPLLLTQLLWFIRLRWVAGGTVVLFALADLYLHWYSRPWQMLAVGVAILGFNCAMWFASHGGLARYGRALAWAQIVGDLSCLTLLTAWTGGVWSPLMGFYVFHMIFASLLLPQRVAYAGAAISLAMVVTMLWWIGSWHELKRGEMHTLAGWAASLTLTVYLANRITRAMRRQRRQLIRQNRQIRQIGRKVRRQQEALVRQEKMAAVGQMAAGITHEIANPLASMDSLLQLLQRRPERITDQSLQSLRTQVSRINQIIRQMNVFAHPGEGHWEKVSPNDVVQTALEMIRYDKRLANVEVVRELDEKVGPVRMIPQAMQQVLINLMTNALDAMADTPSPRLVIKTERTSEHCLIHIIDNGHGIAPGNMRRIFEPFFTTKPVGKGTGVGLSISYSLVQKQGGDIRIASRPGQGATFSIRLPCHA